MITPQNWVLIQKLFCEKKSTQFQSQTYVNQEESVW